MAKQQIGIVRDLYCYPVKSMLGQRLNEAQIDRLGMIGDRVFALREDNDRIVSAKNRPQMFKFRAEYVESPVQKSLPMLRITLPNGRTIAAKDPHASTVLSEALGRPVTLEQRPSSNNRAEFDMDAFTIFDGIPTGDVVGIQPADFPSTWSMLAGSFHDEFRISILTTGTLMYIDKLSNGESQWDVRRFRPNIFVETESTVQGFVEDAWLDGILQIGKGVRLTDIKRNIRCVMTTLPQEDLNKDMQIIRSILKHHDNYLGVGATVEARGTIQVGDPVFLKT